MTPLRSPARAWIALSVTTMMLTLAPRVGARMRCLTPEAGRAVGDALAAGTVARRLPSGFAIENVEIGGQSIAMSVRGPEERRYPLTLTVAPTDDPARRRFVIDVGDGSDRPPGEVADALEAAAGVLGAAIPDSVLADCSGGGDGAGGRVGGPDGPQAPTLSPALALASAGAAVSIIVAAILFGLATIRSRPD